MFFVRKCCFLLRDVLYWGLRRKAEDSLRKKKMRKEKEEMR